MGFLEALKIPDAWISDDFQYVVEHLKSDGYCLLQDEPSIRWVYLYRRRNLLSNQTVIEAPCCYADDRHHD